MEIAALVDFFAFDAAPGEQARAQPGLSRRQHQGLGPHSEAHPFAERLAQFFFAGAGERRHPYANGASAGVPVDPRRKAGAQVDLVAYHKLRNLLRADFAEHGPHLFSPLSPPRAGRVNDVDKQLRRHGFLECRLEGLDQLVGQMADEADRVRQNRLAETRQADPPQPRIEGGEQLIGGVAFGAGQAVEQRGLAGVGVAHQRYRWQFRPPAGIAAEFAAAVNPAEAFADRLDALADHALVELKLLLAGAAQADAALLPVEMRPAALEPRAQVAQLGELNLELALVGTRPLGEDVEDEAGAVEHPAAQFALEIALLARRQPMIEQHEFGAVGLPHRHELADLARADESRRFRPVAGTGDDGHRRGAGGDRQFLEFSQIFPVLLRGDVDVHEHTVFPGVWPLEKQARPQTRGRGDSPAPAGANLEASIRNRHLRPDRRPGDSPESSPSARAPPWKSRACRPSGSRHS